MHHVLENILISYYLNINEQTDGRTNSQRFLPLGNKTLNIINRKIYHQKMKKDFEVRTFSQYNGLISSHPNVILETNLVTKG